MICCALRRLRFVVFGCAHSQDPDLAFWTCHMRIARCCCALVTIGCAHFQDPALGLLGEQTAIQTLNVHLERWLR